MTKDNFGFYFPKILLIIAWEIIYFPIWWYSRGLVEFLLKVNVLLKRQWLVIGLGVWLKNIFTPMYGQRDFASRAISFVMRLFQIVFRGAGFLIFLALSLAAIFLWIFLPLFLIFAVFV
jgi:hypothetical protein